MTPHELDISLRELYLHFENPRRSAAFGYHSTLLVAISYVVRFNKPTPEASCIENTTLRSNMGNVIIASRHTKNCTRCFETAQSAIDGSCVNANKR